jgi:hypothetical protein
MARIKPDVELSPESRRNKRWRLNHPEQSAEIGRRTYIRTQETILQKAYGISRETLIRMQLEQDNRCYICGLPETATRNGVVRRLTIDHNHRTGKVRHLLCSACNLLIGQCHENPLLLEKAAAYLRTENANYTE